MPMDNNSIYFSDNKKHYLYKNVSNIDDNFFPPNLEWFNLYHFDYSVFQLSKFPETLKFISITGNRENTVEMQKHFLDKLPHSLNHIIIETNDWHGNFSDLPCQIERLKITREKNNTEPLYCLPPNLKYLDITMPYCHNGIITTNNFLDFLPHGLKELHLGAHTHYNLSNLPSTLEYLRINMECDFYGEINDLPDSLNTIEVYDMHDECNIYEIIDKLYKIRFKNIKTIVIGCNYLYDFKCYEKNLLDHLQEVLHNCNREDIEINY